MRIAAAGSATRMGSSRTQSTADSTGGEVKSGPVGAAVTAAPRRGIPPSACAPQYYEGVPWASETVSLHETYTDFMKAPRSLLGRKLHRRSVPFRRESSEPTMNVPATG